MTSNPERDLHTYLAADAAHADRDAISDPANTIPVQSIEGGPMMPPEFWQHVQVGVPIDVSPGAFIKVAPAGLPLHEPTDRDADNVPSDRVRAYAEAIDEADSGATVYPKLARAAMAVADREQAALRAEVEWLRERVLKLEQALIHEGDRAEKAEDTTARVEALARLWEARAASDLTFAETAPEEVRESMRDAAYDLRYKAQALRNTLADPASKPQGEHAALRGPEPTDAP